MAYMIGVFVALTFVNPVLSAIFSVLIVGAMDLWLSPGGDGFGAWPNMLILLAMLGLLPGFVAAVLLLVIGAYVEQRWLRLILSFLVGWLTFGPMIGGIFFNLDPLDPASFPAWAPLALAGAIGAFLSLLAVEHYFPRLRTR